MNPNPNFEILNSDYYVSHKDYSYQIDMPKEYLEGFVKLGTKEFNFIFWLKNDGKQVWCKDTVLKKDESSDFNIPEIILESQKPNESRNYQIKVNNIQNYPGGEIQCCFYIWNW